MFAPGSHLRVHRNLRFARLPYWHHGICVANSEVIEFGGGDLWNKGQTKVRRTPLAAFVQGDRVEAVKHPITWVGATYSEQLPPEEMIDRAEWLLNNQPPPYRLGYRNCESIAVWCATGDFESFQVKTFMRWRIAASIFAFVVLIKTPKIGKPLIALLGASSLATAVPYVHSRSFFDHTRRYPGAGHWIRRNCEGDDLHST